MMATCDNSYQSGVVSEILGRETKHHCSKIRKIQSRGVFLVLLWTFAVNAVGYTVFQLAVRRDWIPQGIYTQEAAAIAVVILLCPLAGWLADVYFGRYKILKVSLWLMWISTGGLVILSTLLIASVSIPGAIMTTVGVLIGLTMGFSYAAFMANGIPFAMDQMPAASGEQVSALITWYIWASYLGATAAQLGTIAYSDYDEGYKTQLYVTLAILAILTIAISCGMIFHSNLTIEPQSRNPWKTVFKVLKYAATHKHPENRSALTYCEDPPSRMDLGKNRYGGPYTTEEVEDVKTFLRIVAVILSITMTATSIYFCKNSSENIFKILKGAGNQNFYTYNAIQFSYSEGVLIGLYIPLYEFVIYPFMRNSVPPTLKRVVISAFGMVIMSIYLLTIDIAGHYSSGQNITCIFNITHRNDDIELLPVHFVVLSFPFQILQACTKLLYSVSALQFICAQAPYSMKGLLIGLGFLVTYFSRCIVYAVQGGFHYKWKHQYSNVNSLAASCGFWYFISTLIISIVGLVIVSLAAKWYKKREREDPHNDRMFIEAYYERYCVNPLPSEETSSNET